MKKRILFLTLAIVLVTSGKSALCMIQSITDLLKGTFSLPISRQGKEDELEFDELVENTDSDKPIVDVQKIKRKLREQHERDKRNQYKIKKQIEKGNNALDLTLSYAEESIDH